MSGFANPIIGGDGTLVYPAIQSPNFSLSPFQGWKLDKNGTLYAADIVLPDGTGVSVFFSATAPTTDHVGDLWYNIADGLALSQWNGTAWVAYQIGTGAIANNAITQALIAAGAVGTSEIASAAITNALLAAAAVGTANIASGAVTSAQIAAAAGILGSQLANSTVTGTQLNASVTARSLGGVTTTIAGTAPASPVAGDLWVNSASGYQLERYSGSAWVPIAWNAASVLSAATITGSLIAASTITAGNIAAGTITATQIAAGTITSGLIAANAITTGLIAAGAVTATQIAANTITAAQIAANTITAAQIAAGTITATNILANTITAGQISAGSLTNGTLAAWAVDGVISTASFHGLNMIPDPQFSNATVNAARQADPVTAGTWTLGSGEAVVVERASANILALVSSAEKPFWVNPGEQYYYSITVNRSGSSTSSIGLQFVGATTVTESTAAAGTTTLSGVFTVPSGWSSMYLRLFTNPDATHTDTITFTSPVVQPASLFSPTIYGTDYIINPNGAFFYSGTPAAGNLLIAIANSSGSDAYGNPYYEGIAVFQPNGQSVFIGPDGGTPVIQMTPASTAHMLAPPQVFASASSAGGAAEQLAVAMSSGTESGNTSMTAGFTLISGANNGSQAAVFNAYAGPVSLQLKNNNAQVTTGGGLAGNPVLSQCDLSSNTAGTTSYSDVTKDWAIPANDAQVGTAYRLKVYGSGAEASGTSVLLGLQILGFGNSEAPTGMAAGVIAAGTGFSWWAEAVIIVKNTGASGTAEYSMHGAIALNGRASASSSASFSGHNTTVSINTTAATTMSIQAAWGSISGSPTVTGFSSTFERMGP